MSLRVSANQSAAGFFQGRVARGFTLADTRRNHGDNAADAPFGAGHAVVVTRFNRDLDGQEAATQQGIARRQRVRASPLLGLTVQAFQRAPILAAAGAQHHRDLADAVVVTHRIAQLERLQVFQEHAARCIFQLDVGRLVDDRTHRKHVGLRDQHLAKAGRDL